MSDNVLIVLIVAAAVVVVLYLFRRQLRDFVFKASRQGLEARLSTHRPEGTSAPDQPATGSAPRPGVTISGNVQTGRDHKIRVGRDDVQVSDNLQQGRGQEISVEPDEK
jgi:hypothetical protein